MAIHVITNFVVIYIRRRRIIIDDPDVKFFILIMMYYNAMDWVSVGWLVALSGARPLHQCLVSYTSTFFHFLDTIVLFYAFTGDFLILKLITSLLFSMETSKLSPIAQEITNLQTGQQPQETLAMTDALSTNC